VNTYTLEPANFYDYRDFLKIRFESLKKTNPRFSLLACSQRSKISKSFLQFLFLKKRHISLDKFPALAKTLKLNSEEEYFVYLLICKNSSTNPTIQNHFELILSRIRHSVVEVPSSAPPLSTKSEKSLYQNYLLMVLQTLTRLEGFQEDPEWIKEKLNIKNLDQKRIENSLADLEKKNYLFRDINKKLKADPTTLWRPDPFDPSGYSVYRHAAESIAELLKHAEIYKPAVYMAMSLAMDEKNLIAAEKYMIEVHHKLNDFAKASVQPTSVVYIGNFLLTLARLKTK
jgi:uncharacterized protein (TIGR02147 family)